MKESILKNIKTLHKSANLVYNTKDYTSATVLYFKTLFGVLDYTILLKTGSMPKSHTERFKILKEQFPHYYIIIDKYFMVYQQTYSTTIEKSTCDKIKENVKKIIEEQKINT